MYQLLAEALTLGLSTGVFCISTCAPICVPYLVAEERRQKLANLKVILEFSLGRLIAYVSFGLVVGYISSKVGTFLPGRAVGIAMMVLAVLMILYGIIQGFPHLKLCASIGLKMGKLNVPVVLGLLTGINLCPPFILAAARVFERGEVLAGALFFAVFFLATSIYIVPLVLFGHFARFEAARHVARGVSILVGVWFLFAGLRMVA